MGFNVPRRPHDNRVKASKEAKMIYFIHILQKKIKYCYIFIALLFNICDASSIKNLPASNIQKYIDEESNFDIKAIDENGNLVTLETLRDNVVIVVFFTTWCGNCPDVLLAFDNLLNKIREKGIKNIKVIALNMGKEDINDVKLHYKMHDIQLLDAYQSVSSSMANGINAIPVSLVFDTKGKLVWGCIGKCMDFSSDEFLNAIAE